MWPVSSSDADKKLSVLIVGAERALEEECRSALSRVPDRQATLFFAETYHDAVDVARRRQPNLILIDIDRGVDEIAGLA
ncbi:MAG: hypothetical protein HY824_08890 [Acidobacteria bacterium]|nr:hypothetical protein [Acidobacteriota bacterium]